MNNEQYRLLNAMSDILALERRIIAIEDGFNAIREHVESEITALNTQTVALLGFQTALREQVAAMPKPKPVDNSLPHSECNTLREQLATARRLLIDSHAKFNGFLTVPFNDVHASQVDALSPLADKVFRFLEATQ